MRASGGNRGAAKRLRGQAGMQWRLKLTTHSRGHHALRGPIASAR